MPKKKLLHVILVVCCIHITTVLFAQNDSIGKEEVDAYDLIGHISHQFDNHHHDSVLTKSGKYHFPILPVLGYSLATGVVAGLATSVAFYTTESKEANVSDILTQLIYTEKNQVIFTIQPVIWTKDNKYLIKADYIYLNYPTQTFGLGTRTTTNDINYIDYSKIRVYQSVLREVIPDFYLGVGYNLDYHWNITQTGSADENSRSTYTSYGYTPKSVSSGFTLNFLYDNRRNSINPKNGFYLNTVYRQNERFLGSDENWKSLILDVRKYFTLPGKAKNVLAFWSYNNFTLDGKPPYLDLPATGLDEYGNTGRGYIQGRYRGRNMKDLESEFRFRVTKNGLLGGAVFVNAQNFGNRPESFFVNVIPGGGVGLRIKVHKHTDTNLCIDYGFGTDGSNGLFLNLNEVF